MFTIKTTNSEETQKIGNILSQLLKPGYVIKLEGDLGAGKTTFVQGVAKGLKIEQAVTSPTFTIAHQYEGKIPIFHIDAYRIQSEFELYDLGLEEMIYGDGITFIEWPENIVSILPEFYLSIYINRDDAENIRNLTFTAEGKEYEELIKELKSKC